MTPADDRDPLDLLLEQFTAALRNGEQPDVEEWASRHPEHEADIRSLFPTIVAIEGVREEHSRSGSGRPVGIGVVERLGDFRIVSEIGRGGMGVVYEAEQESLGRRVAVKVLPPMRDKTRMRRFEREARTAARLHHTNIVPIFGVGEHDGWHYYVMQVIRGVGLDVVLRTMRGNASGRPAGSTARSATQTVRMLHGGPLRQPQYGAVVAAAGAAAGTNGSPDPSAPGDAAMLPSTPAAGYWQNVAEIGRQVANALTYAHAQGVLHRDVKPANLMLDAHGVVWVTDFGLATAVGHDGALTGSGDLVGTLQYMAPEQLHGRYDARTDVYGLGLTLYELLTLQPAFADGDRGSLIKKIEQGEPTPPGQLRPGIPHDLETIVLKAIQHDPNDRYQTAQELADDLERYLDDRPIRARRANAIEQVWRWCRRNRAVASLAAVTLVAIVGTAIVGWSSYVSTSRALREVSAEKQRATKNLGYALDAFDDILQWIGGSDGVEVVIDQFDEETTYEWYAPSVVSAEAVALSERLLAFYDRFAEENAESEELRAQTAKAHRRVGDLLAKLGRNRDAEAAYRRALEILQALDAGTGSYNVTIAAVRNDLADLWQPSRRGSSERRQEAREQCEAALALLEGDESPSARFERARAHESLGRSSRRGDGGQDHLHAAHDLARALADEQPDNPAFQAASARVGRHLLRTRLPAEERAAIAKDAIGRLERLVARHPDEKWYQIELVHTYITVVHPRGPDRDNAAIPEAEALGYARRARDLSESIFARWPDDRERAGLLPFALTTFASLWADEDPAAAEAALRRAIEVCEAASESDETDWFVVAIRMQLLRNLLHNGRLDAAGVVLDRLEPLLEDEKLRDWTARQFRQNLRHLLGALERLPDDEATRTLEARLEALAERLPPPRRDR